MCTAGILSALSIELGRNVVSCESDEGYSGIIMKELLDLKTMKEDSNTTIYWAEYNIMLE